MEPTVVIDQKAKTVVITLPLRDPKPSKSGKTLVIATTNGNMKTPTTFKHKGQEYPVTVGVNAYIPNPGE